MSGHIRSMQREDIDAVYQLEADANPFAWSKQTFMTCLQSHYHSVVLPFEKKVIGFLIWQQVIDEVHVLNLNVHKTFRRQGFAQQLMQHLFLQCDDSIRLMTLEVRDSNQVAQDLYQKLGFVYIGKRPHYYRTHSGSEDAKIYHLNLRT